METIVQHTVNALRTKFSAAEARELAFWVLEDLTGLSRAQLLMWEEPAPQTLANQVDSAVARVLAGEPVQYVFGHTLWMGLDLRLTPDTLIPRPETAGLIEWLESRLSDSARAKRVLDIGTGSGSIAIALKRRHPDWQVDACDISAAALQVAEDNARRNNADVHFFRCDILHAIPAGTYDLIISNPPYVCEEEKVSMESSVLDHEPATALFVPDHDPLLFYRRITHLAADREIGLLRPDGHLFFEINERFGDDMLSLLREYSFVETEIGEDMFGKPRYAAAKSPSCPDRHDNLFARAAAYCSTAERCVQEVRCKLRDWGEEDGAAADAVLERLEEEGFVDEARYARAFANDKLRFQRWGRQKIRQGLVLKGLPKQAIDAALSGLDAHDYREALQWCLRKKERELQREPDSDKKRAKLWRFLASRGFTDAEIASVV